VIRAAETDAQDVAMPKNPPGQAALSSQTNVAISDNLEDGELEEEPESAVTFNSGYSNGETHVCNNPRGDFTSSLICL